MLRAQLVLMAIETDALINQLNGGRRAAPIGPLYSALLQPLMIQCGTIPRFHMNNLRSAIDNRLPRWQMGVGAALWVAALASFCATTWSVLDHIGPLADYTDSTARGEAQALQILAWVQVLYPVVSFIDFCWMRLPLGFESNEYDARLSTFKDVRAPFHPSTPPPHPPPPPPPLALC